MLHPPPDHFSFAGFIPSEISFYPLWNIYRSVLLAYERAQVVFKVLVLKTCPGFLLLWTAYTSTIQTQEVVATPTPRTLQQQPTLCAGSRRYSPPTVIESGGIWAYINLGTHIGKRFPHIVHLPSPHLQLFLGHLWLIKSTCLNLPRVTIFHRSDATATHFFITQFCVSAILGLRS